LEVQGLSKIRVGLLFGGKSAEHEVSLQSAKNVLAALDRDRYEVVLIGIDKSGKWYWHKDSMNLLNEDDPKLINLKFVRAGAGSGARCGDRSANKRQGQQHLGRILMWHFPYLHGTFGEDGTVQGMLKLANIPLWVPAYWGLRVGMDKDVMKRLLRADNIPIADFLTFTYADRNKIDYDEVTNRLGSPVFVKAGKYGLLRRYQQGV
jgi:D-alanine-D-alanine ligase